MRHLEPFTHEKTPIGSNVWIHTSYTRDPLLYLVSPGFRVVESFNSDATPLCTSRESSLEVQSGEFQREQEVQLHPKGLSSQRPKRPFPAIPSTLQS